MRDGSRALRTRRGAGSSGARIVQGAREACPSQMGGETLKPSATGAVSAAASPRGDSTHSSRPWTWVGGDVASTAVNSVRMRRRVRHRPAPAQRRAALEIPPLPEGCTFAECKSRVLRHRHVGAELNLSPHCSRIVRAIASR